MGTMQAVGNNAVYLFLSFFEFAQFIMPYRGDTTKASPHGEKFICNESSPFKIF